MKDDVLLICTANKLRSRTSVVLMPWGRLLIFLRLGYFEAGERILRKSENKAQGVPPQPTKIT